MSGTRTSLEPLPRAVRPYVSIFASELMLMAGNAAAWGNQETGGGLFGLETHNDRTVVLLATPPSPRAMHLPTEFFQDVRHFVESHDFLNCHFALQLVGDHHSHHTLILTEPSCHDLHGARSLMKKNGINRYAQLIVTHNGGGSTDHDRRISREAQREPREKTHDACVSHSVPTADFHEGWSVAVNIFLLSRSTFQPVPVPIRILPGISPFRLALEYSGYANCAGLRFNTPFFPLNQIAYDDIDAVYPSECRDGHNQLLLRETKGVSIDIPARSPSKADVRHPRTLAQSLTTEQTRVRYGNLACCRRNCRCRRTSQVLKNRMVTNKKGGAE